MGLSGSQPAYLLAQGGVMRGATSRGNVSSKNLFVKIAGVQYATARAVDSQKVLNETLSITETDGSTPNTCSFQVQGFTPSDGQEVIITQGSINNLDRLFAGIVLSDQHGYVGTPANGTDAVSVIDYTWLLTRSTISQRWLTTSATVIAQAILAAVPGFTSLKVEANLPVLDEFTVTNQTPAQALDALVARIGGSWKATYTKDVRLGINPDPNQTAPTTITDASALLTQMSAFSVTRDLGPVITRQPVEGGGSTALTEVAPGETILPLAEIAWYNPAGGTVVSGPQRIAYSGLQSGGGGTLVGPGMGPASALTLARTAGSGVESGTHQYASTFVTAAGESLPSPLATIVVGTLSVPATKLTAVSSGLNGTPSPIGYYGYAYTNVDATTGESADCGRDNNSVFYADGATNNTFQSSVPVGPAGTVARKVYRTAVQTSNANALTAQLKYLGTITDNVSTGFVDLIVNDANLGANVPVSGNQVVPSNVPIGASSVTARKLYRSVAGGTQLKLQQTISDNTTTVGVTDATADASLGANVPTTDTSGLTQPGGQILAGSSSILVAGIGANFVAGGGWALLGSGQAVRYTGITGNTLTGIPATGPGALTATVSYNTTILAAPALTGIPASGVGAILYQIHQGDQVNLRVVIDDLSAQATIAARLGGGDSGIIEGLVIQDGRLSETEARARGTASLALKSTIDTHVGYTTHDRNTHASRTVAVNLPTAPTSTVGSFKLQSVTIDSFYPAIWPTVTATAASRRFTFEDLLRQARSGT